MAVHPVGSRQPLRLLRRRAFLALGLSAVGLLAACAAPSSPTASPKPAATAPPAPTTPPQPAATAPAKAEPPKPAATAAPPTPRPVTKVRFGTTSLLFQSTTYYLGVEKGFYREQGVDLGIQHFEGDAVLQKAIIAGEVDVADFNPASGLSAIDKGAAIKTIGAIDPYLNFVIIVRNDMNSLADVLGRNVGISAPGSLPHVIMLGLLEREGLDPNKVNWIPTGASAARLQAMAAGRVDVAPNPAEWAFVIRKMPEFKVLLTVKDKLPELLRGTLWVQEKDVREKNDLLVRQMVGHLRAVRYVLEHKQETVDAGAKILGRDKPEDREEMAFAFDFYVRSLWEPNGRLDPKALQFMQEMNVKIGTQAQTHPVDRAYTPEIIDKALAIAGEYRKT